MIISVGLVLFAVFVFPYLKRNNLINTQDLQDAKAILILGASIVKEIKPDLPLIDVISKVAEKSITFVEKTMDVTDGTQKKEAAINTTIELLGILGYEINAEQEDLIKQTVATTMSYLVS